MTDDLFSMEAIKKPGEAEDLNLRLSGDELALIQRYADSHKQTLEQAAQALLSDGLNCRVKRFTGANDAPAKVLMFRKKG